MPIISIEPVRSVQINRERELLAFRIRTNHEFGLELAKSLGVWYPKKGIVAIPTLVGYCRMAIAKWACPIGVRHKTVYMAIILFHTARSIIAFPTVKGQRDQTRMALS